MVEENKSYIMKFRCRNCANTWEQRIEFGKDVETRHFPDTATSIVGAGFGDWEIVSCGNCGSLRVVKVVKW